MAAQEAEEAAIKRMVSVDRTKAAAPWWTASALTVWKITIQYMQIISVTATVYTGVTWPGSFQSTMGGLQVLSSNPFSVAMPSCIDPSWALNTHASFRIIAIFPMSVLVAISLYYKIKSLSVTPEAACCPVHTCKDKGCVAESFSGDKYCGQEKCIKKRPSQLASATDNLCAYVSGTRGRCKLPRMIGGIRLLKAECISAAGLLFFFLYPSICVTCVQVLAECHTMCHDSEGLDCKTYLRADYSLRCDTDEHGLYKIAAGIYFAIVGIMCPVALTMYIRTHREEFLSDDPTNTPSAMALGLGFFYRPFKDKKIHWEVVELFGKLAITSLVVFIEPGTPLQLYMGICFAAIHWAIDSRAAPFDRFAENRLHTLSQGAIFLTLVLGGIVQSGIAGTANVSADLTATCMLMINVSVVGCAIALLALNAREAAKQKLINNSSLKRQGSTVGDRATVAAAAHARANHTIENPAYEEGGGYLDVSPDDEDATTKKKSSSKGKKRSSKKKKGSTNQRPQRKDSMESVDGFGIADSEEEDGFGQTSATKPSGTSF